MIILCPKCSTGFNLPEKHITPRGAKLRCSKCSHVFRVRSGAGDEPEIFYKPEDDEANAAQERAAAPPEPVKTYAAPRRPMLDDEDEDDRVQAIGGATRMGLGVSHEPAGNGTQLGIGGGISEVSSPNHKTQFGSPGLSEASSPNHRTQFGAAGLAARGGDEEPGTMDLGPHLASGRGPALGAHTQFGPGSIAATREKSSPQLKSPPLGKIGGSLDAIGAAKPEVGAGQTLEWRTSKPEPTAQGLDLFGEEDKEISEAFEGEDPFAGAFELSSSAALKKPKRPRSMLFDEQEADDKPKEDILMPAKPGAARAAPAPGLHEGLGGASSFVEMDPAPSTPRRAAALPDDVPEPAPAPASAGMWGGGQDAFGMDDMVDPDFGKDAPAFDMSRGVIEPTSTPSPQPARPSQASQPAAQPARPAPAPVQLASAGPQAAPRAQAAAAAPAAHTIGGSGPQKAANMALIVLAVLFLFLGLLAALNDMMLDFKRFGHMLEVGFGGEPFKPRPEWLTGAAQAEAPTADGPVKEGAGEVKAAAREVLHVRGVWAQVAPWTKKKEVLVVRGQVQNDDLQDYVEVRVKVQVVDGQGKVVVEQEAPVGAWVTNAQIKGLGPAKQPSTLMPEKPSKLATRGSEPFTVIFDEVPKGVEAGEQVGYRVEISKRVGEKDLMK